MKLAWLLLALAACASGCEDEADQPQQLLLFATPQPVSSSGVSTVTAEVDNGKKTFFCVLVTAQRGTLSTAGGITATPPVDGGICSGAHCLFLQTAANDPHRAFAIYTPNGLGNDALTGELFGADCPPAANATPTATTATVITVSDSTQATSTDAAVPPAEPADAALTGGDL